MSIPQFKSTLNILEISSPLIVYLILLVFLKILLEKLPFLEHPALKSFLPLIKGILHFFIILICIIYGLGMLGIDVQGIIAGLGLFSFAISFALKDAISNFISGLSILVYKPFKVGDFIKIDDYSGEVKKMDIRYTMIEAGEELYLIPNSYIIGAKIILKKDSHNYAKDHPIKFSNTSK